MTLLYAPIATYGVFIVSGPWPAATMANRARLVIANFIGENKYSPRQCGCIWTGRYLCSGQGLWYMLCHVLPKYHGTLGVDNRRLILLCLPWFSLNTANMLTSSMKLLPIVRSVLSHINSVLTACKPRRVPNEYFATGPDCVS
jgi:hypothetical protein